GSHWLNDATSNERALIQFHALGSALSRFIYVTFESSLLMTARTWRLGLLSRFAGNFLWCGRGFPMLARVFVRGPEGRPARLRLVSFRRTEPFTARERKHRSERKRGKNLLHVS